MAALAGGIGGGINQPKKKKAVSVSAMLVKVEKELAKAESELKGYRQRGVTAKELSMVVDALRGLTEIASSASKKKGEGGEDEGGEGVVVALADRLKATAAAAAASLSEAEERAAATEKACQARMTATTQEMEKWARRKLEAPNRGAVEAERERARLTRDQYR